MIPEMKHRLYVDVQAVFLLCPCDGTWHTYLSQTQGFGSSNLPTDTFTEVRTHALKVQPLPTEERHEQCIEFRAVIAFGDIA